jgi:hypothetical protein
MVDESEGIYFFLSLYFIYFHIFFEEIWYII